ncbi:alanine:cation symporter family protein, partial [Micrococcus luteus]|uniref:alanine:cation symporter family protein n=1 Tax=Micrococcus luteus TaxID=1270 RepID=UPI0020138768
MPGVHGTRRGDGGVDSPGHGGQDLHGRTPLSTTDGRSSLGYFGGPAYYIRDGLGAKWLAAVFAVAITVTYGFVFNAVQSNS